MPPRIAAVPPALLSLLLAASAASADPAGDALSAPSPGETALAGASHEAQAMADAGPARPTLEQRRALNQRLLEAAAASDVAELEALLAAGASVNARDESRRSALMHAVAAGHAVTERVIQEGLGARVEIVGLPAPAVSEAQRAAIRLLLARGADVEAADDSGKTALVVAVERDYRGVAEDLLGAGAEPDLRLASGLPLVCLAASRGFAGTLEALLIAGAARDVRGMHGKHALHYAAEENHLDVAKLLLDRGTPVDLTSAADWTALHTAVSRGHADMTRLLLARGARADAKTARGLTPAAIATARGYRELTEALELALAP